MKHSAANNTLIINTLNEISQVAAVKATGSLSKLLGLPIGVNMTPIELIQVKEINTIRDDETIGLHIEVLGKFFGSALMIFEKSSAMEICHLLFRRNESAVKDELTTDDKSALLEVANIVIGNFLTAFANPLKINDVMHKAPSLTEKLDTLMNNISHNLANNIEEGIVIDISFEFQHKKIKGRVILLFNEEAIITSIKKVLTK